MKQYLAVCESGLFWQICSQQIQHPLNHCIQPSAQQPSANSTCQKLPCLIRRVGGLGFCLPLVWEDSKYKIIPLNTRFINQAWQAGRSYHCCMGGHPLFQENEIHGDEKKRRDIKESLNLWLGHSTGRKDLISDLPSSKICCKAQDCCWAGTCARLHCPSYHSGVDAQGWWHWGTSPLQGHRAAAATLCAHSGTTNDVRKPSQGSWWGLYSALLLPCCGKLFFTPQGTELVWAQQLTKAEVSKYFCLDTIIASGSSSNRLLLTLVHPAAVSGRCWSTTLRYLVYCEQYVYHSSGTSILQETSPGLASCDSDSLGKESSPSLNRCESPHWPWASGRAAMETMDKLAIIMEAWQQILEDAIANYHIPLQPQHVLNLCCPLLQV